MLKNKTFLVTGSSSGIGETIADFLLKNDAKVIGISRKKNNFKNLKNFFHIKIDLSKPFNAFEKVKQIITNFREIDGLISNAGTGDFRSLENFSSNQIGKFISLNLTSHILITRALLPHFKKNKNGSIIYIGSESALKAKKYGSLYSACKFGLRGFSKSIRDECSNNNIKVTIINPGMVKTSFFQNLDFSHGDKEGEFIETSDIGKIVLDILNQRQGLVVDEINLSPLKKVIKFGKKK